MRAIRGALPILKTASQALVLDGAAHDDLLGARHLPELDLAAYVERHGVKAQFQRCAEKRSRRKHSRSRARIEIGHDRHGRDGDIRASPNSFSAEPRGTSFRTAICRCSSRTDIAKPARTPEASEASRMVDILLNSDCGRISAAPQSHCRNSRTDAAQPIMHTCRAKRAFERTSSRRAHRAAALLVAAFAMATQFQHKAPHFAAGRFNFSRNAASTTTGSVDLG